MAFALMFSFIRAAVTTFTTLLYAFVTVDDCICVLHPIKTSIKKSFKTNGNDGSLNVPSTGNLCPKRKLDSTQTTSKASIYPKCDKDFVFLLERVFVLCLANDLMITTTYALGTHGKRGKSR